MKFRFVSVLVLSLGLIISSYSPVSAAWTGIDIGGPTPAGSSEVIGDSATVSASGSDIWGTADQFHFVYLPMSGDGDLTARVASLLGSNGWCKAGVMIRETLDANSKHMFMAITGTNGAAWQGRSETGGGSVNMNDGSSSAPYWVRITRSGNTLTGYKSYDGTSWLVQGEPVNVSMAQNVYVGLAVTSHEPGELAAAEFDNISGSVVSTWIASLVNPSEGQDNISLDGTNLMWGSPAAPPADILNYYVYLDSEYDNISIYDNSHLAWKSWTVPVGGSLSIPTGTLLNDETYYWRVDVEIDQAEDNLAIGNVWNFDTIKMKPQITSHPVNKSALEDDTVTFTVTAASNGGPMTYYWYKEGQVDYLSTVTGGQISQLILANVTTDDNGLYYCLIENAYGTVETTRAFLVVVDPSQIPVGLTAYWQFEGDATDSSGNEHHNQVFNSPSYVTGYNGTGQAINFNGISQYASSGTWDPAAGTDQMTISSWLKWTGTGGTWQGIAGQRNSWDVNQMSWQIEINANNKLTELKQPSSTAPGGFVMPVNQWVYLTFTFDGTVATTYLNGTPTGAGLFSLGNMRDSNWGIGSCEVPIIGEAAGNLFSGAIDEMAVWNRALLPDEVAYLYNNGQGRIVFEPVVRIGLTGDSTEVTENGAVDYFTVRLYSQPQSQVIITVDPAGDPLYVEDLRLNGAEAGETIELIFDPGNWDQPQIVNVVAAIDGIEEGIERALVTFDVDSLDLDFDNVFVQPVVVKIYDSVENVCPESDIDGDCQVGFGDLIVMSEQWFNQTPCSGLNCADLIGEDGVNLHDLALLAEEWQIGIGPVVISEIMAVNDSTDPELPWEDWELFDEEGSNSDWIELCNVANIPINIGGWYLTDDPDDLTKWQFPPDVLMEPQQYVIIFASSKNRVTPNLHTNFELSADGEFLALVGADGETIISSFENFPVSANEDGYPPQISNVSYGLFNYFSEERYFSPATPGYKNASSAVGVVADTKFDIDRGFYEAPFALTISCDTPDAVIRYTVDGSEPTIGKGTEYTGPITIDKTTTLRAAAFKPGWIASNVDTQTYLFLDDIVQQSLSGEKPAVYWPDPGRLGSEDQRIDYGMDPDIVNSPVWGPQMRSALTQIPTMSLVTDLNNLFNPSTNPADGGIYVNANLARADSTSWEKPCSLELINPDGSNGFQVDCGVRIRGGYSRQGANPKHAFRFFFRSRYGDSKLRYPLFEDEGVDEFDKMDLRTSQNYSWSFNGTGSNFHNTFLREVTSRDLQGELGHPYTKSRYYHLYVNGHYWGLFQTQERADASFASSYEGGSRDDYDAVKTDWVVGRRMAVTEGTMDAYHRAYYQAMEGFGTKEKYYRAQGLNPDGTRNLTYEKLLDVENLIDFMIIEYYTGDRDGPGSRYGNIPNNTFSFYNRVKPDGWKFLHHDNEHTLGTGEENMVTPFTSAGSNIDYFNPHWLHEQLAEQNFEYRRQFADRVQELYFHDGPFVPANLWERIQKRAAQIDMAIIAESARWGDSITYPPRTKNDWYNAQDYLYNWIFDSGGPRTQRVIQQLRNVGWFPILDAPELNQHGGYADPGFDVEMTNPNAAGDIFYTNDGTDPWQLASEDEPGEDITVLAENATKYVHVPSGPLPAPTGSVMAEYWLNIDGGDVASLTNRIAVQPFPDATEVRTSFETPTDWAESYGTRIRAYLHPTQSGNYTFWIASDDSSQLWLSNDNNPANAALICYVDGWTNSRQWFNFETQQSSPVALQAGQKYYIEALMKEGNGGDNLAVAWQRDGSNNPQVIQGQYLSAYGEGWVNSNFDHSGWSMNVNMEVIGYEDDPGSSNSFEDIIDIDVWDQMQRTKTSCYVRIPFTYMGGEFNKMTLNARYDDGFIAYLNGIEMLRVNFNEGEIPEWSSFASSNHPDGLALVPEAIDISDYIDLLKVGENVLAIHALNTNNSSDFLFSAEIVAEKINTGYPSPTAVQYSIPVDITKSTQVKSRVYNGSTWSALTNVIYSVGPIAESLRVTEIMYNPADPNHEFIELQNVGGESINLNLVKFTRGIDYTFGDYDLGSGQFVLLVRNQAAFEQKYGTGLPVAGQYTGALNNGGDKIKVKDAVGGKIQTFDYNDWYALTDGLGFSLTIIDAYSTDPNDWDDKDGWRASTYKGGSPGAADIGPSPDSIVINEILAHSHDPDPMNPTPDWIELKNTTNQDIDISGWFLSDEKDNDDPTLMMKYEFPQNTTIKKNDFLVIYEDETFGNQANANSHIQFGLSEGGETLYLRSGDAGQLTGEYQTEQDFDASDRSVTLGRYEKSSLSNGYDFIRMDYPTPGDDNSGPKISDVVISKIMYAPANDGGEYIEIYNRSGSPVTLMRQVTDETSPGVFESNDVPWHIGNAIDYLFPVDTTISAGDYRIIAKNPDGFKAQYPSVPASKVLGPFDDGKLNNGGEKVELRMPGDQEYGKNRYKIPVDEVNYESVAPWPTSPLGGDRLQRIDVDAYANDYENWTSGDPDPTN